MMFGFRSQKGYLHIHGLTVNKKDGQAECSIFTSTRLTGTHHTQSRPDPKGPCMSSLGRVKPMSSPQTQSQHAVTQLASSCSSPDKKLNVKWNQMFALRQKNTTRKSSKANIARSRDCNFTHRLADIRQFHASFKKRLGVLHTAGEDFKGLCVF